MPISTSVITGTVQHSHSLASAEGGYLTEGITGITGGNVGEVLTATATDIPQWLTPAVATGGWNMEGNDINTSLGTDLSVTVTEADVYQVIWNVQAGSGVSTCCMRINDVSSSSYDSMTITNGSGGPDTQTKWLLNGGGSDPSHSGIAYVYKSDSNFDSGNQGGVTMVSQIGRYTTSPVNLSVASGTNDTITGAVTKITLLCMKENTADNEQILGSMRVNSLSYS